MMRKLAALFLLTSIFLAGCGTDVSKNTNESAEENTLEQNEKTGNNEEMTETEEPQENTEEVTEEPTEEPIVEESHEDTSEEPVAEDEQKIIKELEAIYIGQVDTHSIEIQTTDQESMILQTLESEVDFGSINEGSKVNIDYYTNENGQNILKSITVLN